MPPTSFPPYRRRQQQVHQHERRFCYSSCIRPYCSFATIHVLCYLSIWIVLSLIRTPTTTPLVSIQAFTPRLPRSIIHRSSTTTKNSMNSNAATTMTTATTSKPVSMIGKSNQELAQERLAAAQVEKRALQESMEGLSQRNYELKRLLHTPTTTDDDDSQQPQMYQVKVTVCDKLRQELKLSGREKRGRVFLEKNSNAVKYLKSLRGELHGFFRALRKDTYILTAGYPIITVDGKVTSTNETEANATYWPIRHDEDVVDTFRRADDFFQQHNSAQNQASQQLLKRPAIVLRVACDPNAPPPPPPPAYLENMPDPSQSTHMSMLSFYSFPTSGIDNPLDFAETLRQLWKPFQAVGRVYVASEGVNAQMSVPTNVLEAFRTCCESLPLGVGASLRNHGGLNVDPIPLTRAEFAVAGAAAAGGGGGTQPPFTNLHIRVRQQVVADGLDRSYNWDEAGYDMPPLEWHQRLKEERERRQQGQPPAAIVLDCRNTYETELGRFDTAEPLQTETFKDSWEALTERLKDTPRDTPILGYCTGGIRCVKVGAYLQQELGFTNFSRLAGGIIAYDRTLQSQAPTEESLFKGSNFVFDGRLGRPITGDAFGACITCGARTALVTNCRNNNCHQRMVQCEACATQYHGTCSEACRNRIMTNKRYYNNRAMRPRRVSSDEISSSERSNEEIVEERVVYKTLDEYSAGHSSPINGFYAEIEYNTQALIPTGSHMLSGRAQGQLLTQLVSLTRNGRVLEIGTFTGYATACLVEGVRHAARAIGATTPGNRKAGPYILTMERDPKAYSVAVEQLRILSKHGMGQTAAEVLAALRGGQPPVLVNEEIVTLSIGEATCELLRVSDALATVEEMAAGWGYMSSSCGSFDLVFLDADKTRLVEYVDALVSSDRVLQRGGMIVVDNVLWKGLVLEAASGGAASASDSESEDNDDTINHDCFTESASAIRKNRRARKLANKMHRFNQAMAVDERVEVLVLPFRDGLSVIRKK